MESNSCSNSSIYAELRQIKKPVVKKEIAGCELIQINTVRQPNHNADVIANANATIEQLFGVKTKKKVAKPQKVDRLEKEHKAIDTTAVFNDIVALLYATDLTPLKTNNEIIHDNATLAAKCATGHIHKYFLKDIQHTQGNIHCITCSVTNKFANRVRIICEELLHTPFILDDTTETTKDQIWYINPVYRVKICCVRKPGLCNSELIDVNNQQWLIITIHFTSSDRIIKQQLSGYLCKLSTLSNLQRRRIDPNPPEYQKNQIPYTTALAENFGLSALCVEDDLLYFESTGNP